MKKILLTLTAIIAFGFIIKAQNVTFNDPNLKQRIVLHGQNVTGGVTGPNISIIDADNNGEISIVEAQAYTGRLYLNQNGSNFYTDLTGVEEFTAITELFCENNQMTTLSVSAHPDLTALYCDNNQISSINLSANTDLEYLDMGNNDLTTLDLSSNTNIETVVVDNNSITSIDISTVTSIEQLDISYNPITSINFASATTTNLEYINIVNTDFVNIDVSSQISLNSFYANNCSVLEMIDIKSGYNSSMGDMYAINNPNLDCIKVDDPAVALANVDWIKDATASYSLDCAPPTRYYVDIDATGNNDGSSWADAFIDLRDALTNSYNGMEIWVAEGVYTRQNTTDRNSVFGWSTDSLKVYGGFNGTETTLTQRNWRVNETILSGDIGVVGDDSDNCYTTLVGPIGTVSNIINYSLIDGLIVQDGNANGSANDITRYGGGFFSGDYIVQTDLRNCTFTKNNALYGAVSASTYAYYKTVNFENCIFENNTAISAAAVHSRAYNGYDLTTSFVNCLFVNNEANSDVSGTNQSTLFYFGVNGSATFNINIFNSTISNNTNLYSGSNNVGMTLFYAEQSSSTKNITMKNNIIWNNVNDDVLFIKHSNGNNFTDFSHQNSISDLSSSVSNYTATNVLNSDPLFTDVANNNFTLQGASPAIDAGSQTGLTISALDLAGNNRVEGADVDMGCYEFSCPQFTFQITESNGVLSAPTSFVSYQWSFDGNNIAGATSASYTPTQSGLYTVVVSDGSCPKTRTYFFCSTDLLTLYENNGVLTAPSGFDGYEWFLDGVLIIGASNAVYATTQDGSYYCEAVLFAGPQTCTQTTATVSICSAVSVDITESNGTLTATAGYSDYQWFKDGVVISGAMNDTYVVTEDGTYYCEASENGCTSSSNSIIIDTSTGINDIAFENLNIYPNPTNGIVNLEIKENLSSIKLFDLTGKVIKEFNATSRQLNISEFTSGIYFLEIANTESTSVVKIIKN